MNVSWMLIRGSGLVAFLALAAVTIWGLVLSLGLLPRSVKRLTLIHESLSIGAMAATLVHMGALLFDEFVDFDVVSVLVPGMSTWEPFAVALGVVSFYGLVLVVSSFYVRKRIGQAQWRMLHYLGFGVFAGVLSHGLLAGTDSAHPAVWGMYLVTGVAVAVLITLRIVMAGSPGTGRTESSRRPDASAGPTTRGAASQPGAPVVAEDERAERRRAAIAAAKAKSAADKAVEQTSILEMETTPSVN